MRPWSKCIWRQPFAISKRSIWLTPTCCLQPRIQGAEVWQIFLIAGPRNYTKFSTNTLYKLQYFHLGRLTSSLFGETAHHTHRTFRKFEIHEGNEISILSNACVNAVMPNVIGSLVDQRRMNSWTTVRHCNASADAGNPCTVRDEINL